MRSMRNSPPEPSTSTTKTTHTGAEARSVGNGKKSSRAWMTLNSVGTPTQEASTSTTMHDFRSGGSSTGRA